MTGSARGSTSGLRVGVIAMAAGFCAQRGRAVRRALILGALLPVALACGSGSGKDMSVSTRAISDPTAPHLRVVAPDRQGSWPVVLALHGNGGTGEDMLPLATRLARSGAVVFVPTYNTDFSTADGLTRAGDDISCAYGIARRDAHRYGGDLSEPVTVVGWSLGADLAILGGLGPLNDPSSGRCPGEVIRPDVVVALSGCYYGFDGKQVTWFDDLTGWTPPNVAVRLVSGDRDTTCPGWQTDRLAQSLRTAGYRVAVTRLEGADHGAPVFRGQRDGQWRVLTRDPAGDRTVGLILEAIHTARSTNRTSSRGLAKIGAGAVPLRPGPSCIRSRDGETCGQGVAPVPHRGVGASASPRDVGLWKGGGAQPRIGP